MSEILFCFLLSDIKLHHSLTLIERDFLWKKNQTEQKYKEIFWETLCENISFVDNFHKRFLNDFPDIDSDILYQIAVLCNLTGEYNKEKISDLTDLETVLQNINDFPPINRETALNWLKLYPDIDLFQLYKTNDFFDEQEISKREFDKLMFSIKFKNDIKNTQPNQIGTIVAKILIQYLFPKFKKLGISDKDINKQIETTKINILAVAMKIKLITLKEVKTILDDYFELISKNKNNLSDANEFIIYYLYPKFESITTNKKDTTKSDMLDIVINQIIKDDQNQKTIQQYKSGNEKAINALVGQVIKKFDKDKRPDAQMIIEKIKCSIV